MIVEYIRYQCAHAEPEHVIGAYREATPLLERAQQYISHEVAQCEEDPRSVIVRIHWTSVEDHMKGFRSGPQFRAFLALVRPFIPDIQEMRHYKIL